MRTTVLLTLTLAAAVAGMALAGCGNAISISTDAGTAMPLVGSWLSAGADVAPLLAGPPFNNAKITANFNADSTFTIVSIDTSNKTINYAGTYVTAPSSVPGIITITANQTLPSSAVAQGMFQIDTSVTPNRMNYEAVQTQPTNGLEPPTPEKGFGSSIYNGKPISTLIQKFTRQ